MSDPAYDNDPALRPPSFREISWAQLVRQAWGKKWSEPEVVYRFSNNREFKEYPSGE